MAAGAGGRHAGAPSSAGGLDAAALGGAAWEGWGEAGPGGGDGGGSEAATSSSRDLWELCDAVLDEAEPPLLAAAPRAADGTRARSTSVRIAGRLRPRRLRRRLERGAAERPEDLPDGLRKQASRKSLRAKAAQRTVSLAGKGFAGGADRMRRLIQATGLESPPRPLAFRDLAARATVPMQLPPPPPGEGGVFGAARRRMPALCGRGRASVALFERATGALPANSATALLGGPGSGKSSLLKALAGLLDREPGVQVSGGVYLSGRPVADRKSVV